MSSDDIPGYRAVQPGTQPPGVYVPYEGTKKRAPQQAPIVIPATLSEVTGPTFAAAQLAAHGSDLTAGHAGQPLGQRIIVAGRVIDENDRPVSRVLIELWQCNAAGRYLHGGDQNDAPLDPNFTGFGQVVTDEDGSYRFTTIKPGAYPWLNHHNAWRPPHIHFSLLGPSLGTRLVTQMYFPGDPLLAFDPIFQSVPDGLARQRLVSHLDWEISRPDFALGFRFDIVLRGRTQTPWER
jgi:protocatechuate 3,4-dioxygenase, beta subunit